MTLNRRGIELPVSMIIILVVSMMVFGLAMGLTYKLVCSAEDQLLTVNAQQEQEIERRLLTGPAVIIPDATKSAEQPSTICGGASSAGVVYALGIRNDNPTNTTVTLSCLYKGVEVANPTGDPCGENVQFWPTVEIDRGQRVVTPVAVNVNASMLPGRHVYTMTVTGLEVGLRSASFYLDVK